MFVNRVGLGCMGFSHAYGIAVNREEAIETIRKAYHYGYNFFDTAQCYTGENSDGSISNNEELVGEALKDVKENVIIATKFGVEHKGDHLELDSSPQTICQSVEQSLQKLQTNTIDLYYQHRIDPKVEPEVVANVMKELIREGKIKAWGISEVNEDYLRRAHIVCPITAIENRYSMMARWHESLFSVCKKLNITFVAFSPIANGILSGQFTPQSQFDKGDFRNKMPQYQQKGYQKAKKLLDYLDEIAQQKYCTMTQLSLAWMLKKEDFIVPISGSRNYDRLKENYDSLKIDLNKQDIEKINQLLNTINFNVFGGH